jgi:hypothetical protein
MAITVAETNSVVASVTGTTYALPLAGPVAAGDVLVLLIGGNLSGATINLPAGWTLLTTQFLKANNQYQARVYHRVCAGGESLTIGSFTTTGASTLGACIYRLSGARTLPPAGLEIAGHAGPSAGSMCSCGSPISTSPGLAIGIAVGDVNVAWDNIPGVLVRLTGHTTGLGVGVGDLAVLTANTSILCEAYQNASASINNVGASVFIGDNSWLDSPRVIAPTSGAGMVKRFDPKDPEEVLDYDVDLTALLLAGETVATWTPVVSAGGPGLVVASTQVKAGNARWKGWLSGGISGVIYHVSVLGVTTLGRRLEVDLVIPCLER